MTRRVRLTASDVRLRLRAACDEAGGQAFWAARHGVSPELVSNVLGGRRYLTPRILAPLGLVEREPVYEAAQTSGTRS